MVNLINKVVAIAVFLTLILAGCHSPVHTGGTVERVPDYRRPRPLPPPPRSVPPVSHPEGFDDISSALLGVTIIVDPGHGGKDPGALPRSPGQLPEKALVLDIANRLANQIRSRQGRVIQTRNGDWFIELEERAAISNRSGADLFISIHADASKNRSASGVTIYIERQAYQRTKEIARTLQRSLKDSGFECRGIQRADYKVLKQNQQSAILVECGFMTNSLDAERLNSPWYRQKIAVALADGIVASFGRGR